MTTSKCKYRAATLKEVAANVSDGKQGNKPPDSAKRVPHKCETVSPKLRNWFAKTANNRPSNKRQPERSMPIGNCSRPDDANWTGAEIKSCCRLASLLDVPLVQAAQNVVPVAETAGDKIEALRPDGHGVHRPRPSAGELYSLPSPILSMADVRPTENVEMSWHESPRAPVGQYC